MKNLVIFLGFILMTVTGGVQAQGRLNVKFDRGVEATINSYSTRASEEKIKGFRVQLCSESGNNAKSVANSVKATFLRMHDGIPAYLIWESPNFKVRVGDFRSRLDATLFWKRIMANFPQSYVVTDEINMIRLKE